MLEPLSRRIRTRVLQSLVVRADDTGIRVLDRATPKGVKLGHMWGYVGDGGLVAFDYTPTWEAKGPVAFLEGFEGCLQGDGYAGLNAIFTSLLASCQMHGVEPWSYFRDLLYVLPSWPAHRVLELAPLHWPTTCAGDEVSQVLEANPYRALTLG